MEKTPRKQRATTKRREPGDPLLVAIGRHIRDERERQEINQERFAAKAGIDRAYYGGIERGERNLTITSFLRIAQALGVEAGKILPPMAKIERLLPARRIP